MLGWHALHTPLTGMLRPSWPRRRLSSTLTGLARWPSLLTPLFRGSYRMPSLSFSFQCLNRLYGRRHAPTPSPDNSCRASNKSSFIVCWCQVNLPEITFNKPVTPVYITTVDNGLFHSLWPVYYRSIDQSMSSWPPIVKINEACPLHSTYKKVYLP